MAKIITFLTNDNKIIQQVNNSAPPPNSFAILTNEYDILDTNGNRVQFRDTNLIFEYMRGRLTLTPTCASVFCGILYYDVFYVQIQIFEFL